MPAAGKETTGNVAAAVLRGETVHISIYRNSEGHWAPAVRKTGSVVAKVTGARTDLVQKHRRSSRRYFLETDQGEVPDLAAHQTLTLADTPERPAEPAADAPAEAAPGVLCFLTDDPAEDPADHDTHDHTGDGEAYTEWCKAKFARATETARARLIADKEAELAERKRQRRVDMWTARFMAETVSAEPSRYVEPTYEALDETFAYSPMRDTKVRPLYPAIRAEFHRLIGQLPGYPMSHVKSGDVIRFDGETDTRTVESAWWVSAETKHYMRFADDGVVRAWDRDGAPDVTLVDRPGWGPLNHVYQVGDRVGIITSGIPPREVAGVVAEVIEVPDDHWWGGRVYDVMTVIGGKIAAGADRMRPDPTPMPAAGQRWICASDCRTATVIGVSKDYPSGLVADTDLTHSVELAAPNWRPLTDEEAADADIIEWGRVASGAPRERRKLVLAAQRTVHGLPDDADVPALCRAREQDGRDVATRARLYLAAYRELDKPAEPEPAAEPSEELVDAIMRYGSAGAADGLDRIAAIMASPEVAAILERAAVLTDAERVKLHTVGVEQFRRHRSELTQLHHKVAKACPDGWRDFGMAQDRAWSAVNAGSVGDGSDGFVAHAVADVVYATAARAYLSDEEFRLFARPWLETTGAAA